MNFMDTNLSFNVFWLKQYKDSSQSFSSEEEIKLLQVDIISEKTVDNFCGELRRK